MNPTSELRQSSSGAEPAPGGRIASRGRPNAVAHAYLVALAVAEAVSTLVEPRAGVVLHATILVGLLIHCAVVAERPLRRFLLALSFAPLIRLLSFSLPLATFPLVYWYLVTSVPLFVAAFVAARTLRLSWDLIGLTRQLPIQIPVALTGLAFGYVEYQILRPEPLVRGLTLEQIWLPALILLVCTGFLEELIFRGLIQRTAVEAIGGLGVLYVAILFAVLHLGYRSLIDALFVFGVGLFFGWVVERTKSLVGVTLAHGLTNVALYLVLPHLLTPGAGLPPLLLPFR